MTNTQTTQSLRLFLDEDINAEVLDKMVTMLEEMGHDVYTGDDNYYNVLTAGNGVRFDDAPGLVESVMDAANDQVQWYELREVTGHYEDGTYGTEHVGLEIATDEPCSDPANYMVQWDDAEGDVVEVEANADGEIIVDGTVVAIWVEA